MRLQMLLLFLVATLLGACNFPDEILATVTALPQPTATAATAWQVLEPGLEWRTLRPEGDELAQIVVLRIDPRLYHFRARYRAGEPLGLAHWLELEPSASVIVNANFFDRAYRALGAVVSDGDHFGKAYRDRGGSFVVKNDAASVHGYRDGAVVLDEGVEQAVQGFPLLVHRGEQAYFAAGTTRARSRRTIIAEDRHGKILILVSPLLGLSLAGMSAYLPTTDLEIETAVNLDGGGSTMLAIPDAGYILPSFDAVPTILAVVRRK